MFSVITAALVPAFFVMGLGYFAGKEKIVGLKAPELREAILLAAIPSGFFGILFGLNYGVEFQDTDSTLAISSLVGVLTLGVAILLTARMNQVS